MQDGSQCDMTDVRTQEFTKRVLNHMRERLVDVSGGIW